MKALLLYIALLAYAGYSLADTAARIITTYNMGM